MSLLLRAALVIGALSYCAILRAGGEPPAPHAGLAEEFAGGLAESWAAMPPDLRARAAREGMAALSRRLAATPASSGDTLSGTDRLPPWRGSETR